MRDAQSYCAIILDDLVLLTLYAKAKTDNIIGAKLKEIRRALEDPTPD